MDDASDESIRFDEHGVCNYCTKALSEIYTTTYFPNEEGKRRLDAALAQIKRDGVGKEFDCMMGISGGLDSSYLAYLGYQWGLRILAVHIDDGFDTEISKENIRRLTQAAGIKMLTIQPDARQFNDLTKAYMLAGVPNLAVPQDNVLFAFLYSTMKEYGIKYFLSGGNFALESILQQGNTYNAMDTLNIKDIHKRYGTEPIDKLKFISSYRKYWDMKVLGIKTLRLLDDIDYNRDRAFKELHEFCGFAYYGRKHLENIFTAFVQLYWLPKKFGVDKRTSHLSSMIVSGQMEREQALKELSEPMYDAQMMSEYIEKIKKELQLSDEEFAMIMEAPTKQHCEYRTDHLAMLLRQFIKR